MPPLTSLQKRTAIADEEEELGDVSEEEEMEEYFEEEIIEEAEEDDGVEQVEEKQEKEDHRVPREGVEVEVQKEEEEEEKLAKPAQQSKESSGSELHSPTVDPPFFIAVSHLKKLHNALSVFLYQLDSLNRSFDWTSAAIDALIQRRSHLLEMEKNENSKLQVICETMGGKALRNYVINNLSNRGRLRKELLEVLRCVQNPEKLVLEAMGRFYMQGSRSYKNNEQLVSFRCACILLLESYVLAGRATEDSSVKEEAKTVALAWFKRLINDSSFGDALAMDSLGLILFMACYGIPEEIGFRELCNLLRQTNLKKKANVFRQSNILVEKIPGVIKDLIRADMLVGAAELSCSFGLQETFPPIPLLSSFVAKVMQVGQKEPQDHRPLSLLREGHVQQLRSLESVAKCLEDYDLDANELGPIPIYEEIARLKNETVNCKKESQERKFKRKTEEAEVHRQSKKPSMKPRPSIAKESWSTPKVKPDQGCVVQPQVTNSSNCILDASSNNASLLAARDAAVAGNSTTLMVNDNQHYPYGLSGTYHSTSVSYGSLGLADQTPGAFHGLQPAAAQNFYQPHTSYGNVIRSSARNLYQFADTVIRHELNRERQ